MKAALVLSLGLLAHSAAAVVLNERDAPAVVSFDLERRKVEDPVRREQARRKRDNTVSVDLVNPNDIVLYWINGTAGTPGQSVSLALDTGSSDMWVNVASSDYCSQVSAPCKSLGTYDHSKSSTYKLVDHNLNDTYYSGEGAEGDYVTDTVEFGGATLKNFQFGVAYQSSSNKGILGVGYAASAGGGRDKYNNFPISLVDAGYIKSPAFSLYLNDLHASKGQILFGGVDTSKYVGELQSVPIIQQEGSYYSLAIALTGLSLKKDSNKASSYSSSEFPLMTTLDCGASLVLLPESLANKVYDDLNVSYNSSLGYGILPCSTKNNDWNLTYSFSGIDISVPISEMVLEEVAFEGDETFCLFGISSSNDESIVLMGDPFLRSAYVVYDLGNNEISLAQANFNPGNEHILEIGTGTNAVPGATAVASAVSTVINLPAVATAVQTVTAGSTSSPSSTSGSGSSSGSDSGSSSSSGSHATGAASTSKSKGLAAALPTSEAKHLVAGLAGAAGLLLAL